jgi:phosphoribosylformylglycinamidine synthase
VRLPGDPFVALFAESAGRALVTVGPEHRAAFEALCAAREVPVTELGVVTGGESGLAIAGVGTLPLSELGAAWEPTLARLYGN